MGVDLFFVLSGFLIGRIFLKEVIFSKEQNRKYNLQRFWKRRWFRTLPNYFLFLGLHVFFMSIGLGDDQTQHSAYIIKNTSWKMLIKMPFFLHNFVDLAPGFFQQSWSLSVEEWFYLLLPLLFFAYIKISNNITAKSIIRFLVGTILVLTFWKWFCFNIYPSFFFPGKVIFNFDQILIGVLIAAFYYFYEENLKRIRNLSLFTGVLLFLAGNFILIKFVLVGSPVASAALWMRLTFTMGFACLVIFCVDYSCKKSRFTELVLAISQASYSMYLSHMLILLFFVDRFLMKIPIVENTVGGRVLAYLLFYIVTFLISYIIFVKFEKPVIALRDHKWFNKKQNSIATETTAL